MVSVFSLFLPILLSAAAVFLLSALFHMVLRLHRNEVRGVPDERRVADALRPFAIPPGDYLMPHAEDFEEMGTPEYLEKTKAGPVALLTVFPNEPFAMGKRLGLWFVYSLVVGAFAGYAAGVGLGPGADGAEVFRVVSTVSFAGYALAVAQASIWWGRRWRYTLGAMADGAAYALVTAGLFVWLWP